MNLEETLAKIVELSREELGMVRNSRGYISRDSGGRLSGEFRRGSAVTRGILMHDSRD